MSIGHVLGFVIGILAFAGGFWWLKRKGIFDMAGPERSAEFEVALARLTPFRRDAWVPATKPGNGELTASRFSGIPWLPEDEDWPVCPNCGQPRQLLLQLDLATLPARPEGCPEKGLLQLFYCTNSEDECGVQLEGWRPFSPNAVVRIVNAASPGRAFGRSPVPDAFPPRRIVGWQRKDDYPKDSEASEFGVKLTDDEDKVEDVFDELTDADIPVRGEKLMGWPNWVQGVEYPSCPECGRRMTYLFQIASEHNLPFMFGDSGTGHITFCLNHPSRLAFAWVCC